MEKEENLNQENTTAETSNENKETDEQLGDKHEEIEGTEEKKELSKTKTTVLAKQEERLKISLQEQEQKIQEMLKNPNAPNSDKPSS